MSSKQFKILEYSWCFESFNIYVCCISKKKKGKLEEDRSKEEEEEEEKDCHFSQVSTCKVKKGHFW